MIAKKERSRFEDRRVSVCGQNIGHRVWNCNKFITECSVDKRWKMAKNHQDYQFHTSQLQYKVETFDSMPMKLILESSDGNVKTHFSAYTCPRQITGKYKVVEWKRHQTSWPHLQVCNFPETAFDPVVDVLIDQDHIDLHYSRCDVKGKPGEPIARLGPLGWSCVGYPGRKVKREEMVRTNFAYTFFTRRKKNRYDDFGKLISGE